MLRNTGSFSENDNTVDEAVSTHMSKIGKLGAIGLWRKLAARAAAQKKLKNNRTIRGKLAH